MALLAFGLSNIVQESGGKQARAGRGGVDGRLPAPCEEAIVELESQAGHALGVREIGIESIRPKLHAPRRKHFNLSALGKSGAPDLPERIGPDHLGTVAVDALDALEENYFSPTFARMLIGKHLARDGRGPEHVEVMDLAQQVLDFFQVVSPRFVLDGQKIFHNIAEAFDADAETVECNLGAVAQGTVVEFPGFGPALEREMFKERTTLPEACSSCGQRFAPLPPLFAVEFFESGLRCVLLFRFATTKDSEESLRCRIGWV